MGCIVLKVEFSTVGVDHADGKPGVGGAVKLSMRSAPKVQNSQNIQLRKRLPREERERLIVDEAVRFFAEVGFEGQTRALAERLGVTQPLLIAISPIRIA